MSMTDKGIAALVEYHCKCIDVAMENYRQALKAQIINAMKALAAEDPDAEFEFINAMGVWSFTRKGMITYSDDSEGIAERDIESQPIYGMLSDAEHMYGYQILPWMKIKAKGDQIEVGDV
jgi:hypothetical protein